MIDPFFFMDLLHYKIDSVILSTWFLVRYLVSCCFIQIVGPSCPWGLVYSELGPS